MPQEEAKWGSHISCNSFGLGQTDYFDESNTQALNNITILSQTNKDCTEISNLNMNTTIP
jgi:hypothetical protein